jgi:hypothetical protein
VTRIFNKPTKKSKKRIKLEPVSLFKRSDGNFIPSTTEIKFLLYKNEAVLCHFVKKEKQVLKER